MARRDRAADGAYRTIDYVVVALAKLGGAARAVDIEDVAMECFRIAPHRFRWRRYADQVDLAQVRDGLSDARKPENGILVSGDRKAGWTLTPSGVKFADALAHLDKAPSGPVRIRIDPAVRAAERSRVTGSVAYAKAQSGRAAQVTAQEYRDLLRLDRYANVEKHRQRLGLVIEAFADDPATQALVTELDANYRNGTLGR